MRRDIDAWQRFDPLYRRERKANGKNAEDTFHKAIFGVLVVARRPSAIMRLEVRPMYQPNAPTPQPEPRTLEPETALCADTRETTSPTTPYDPQPLSQVTQ